MSDWTAADLAGLRIVGGTGKRAPGVVSTARKAPDDQRDGIGEIVPPRSRQSVREAAAAILSDAWPWSKMNKTETRYAREFLVGNPRVIEWHYESINLRLGESLFYCPDFLVVMDDGRRRFVEVKGGYVREDAEVKFKAAAMRYTLLAYFEMWQWTKKGGWVCIREI